MLKLKFYPSFTRIIRSSVERFRRANQLRNWGDISLFFGSMSTTVDSSTNGVTLAPLPVLIKALNPDWKSEI